MSNILVSGASGIVGYGILKSLRNHGLHLIGTTIYEDSVCSAFCDTFIKAIPTDDINYIAWLKDVIKNNDVDMIIPGIEDDFYVWYEHLEELSEITTVMMNNQSLITLCRDKWIFFKEMKSAALPYIIDSEIATSPRNKIPFIVKPRRGFGSQGFKIITKPEDFIPSTTMISQPYIDGDEYTVSAFGDGRGNFFNYICMKRTLDKAGFTGTAKRVNVPKMKEILTDLCGHFKPEGPTNFQFRKQGEDFKLLEINPRISSSTSIKTLFGYNECMMAVDYYLNAINPIQPDLKEGTVIRYTEDMVMP